MGTHGTPSGTSPEAKRNAQIVFRDMKAREAQARARLHEINGVLMAQDLEKLGLREREKQALIRARGYTIQRLTAEREALFRFVHSRMAQGEFESVEDTVRHLEGVIEEARRFIFILKKWPE